MKIAIQLLITLGIELWKAYKEAKRQDELDKLQANPGQWMAGHFAGRMPEPAGDKTEAAKADAGRDGSA